MNWTDIYNRVVFEVWGNSVPAQGFPGVLQGEYGIIANAHRKIQEDYNYWFMEQAGTNVLIDGTANYALPVGFKEIIQNGLQLVDATTGDYTLPLSPMQPNDTFNHFRDADEEADYPTFYEIFGGEIILHPTPSLSGVVMRLRCFSYLARPPAVFGVTYDDLTRGGHNAIIYEACANICRIQEEYQKEQRFMEQFRVEIERLMQSDARMRRAECNTVLYSGI